MKVKLEISEESNTTNLKECDMEEKESIQSVISNESSIEIDTESENYQPLSVSGKKRSALINLAISFIIVAIDDCNRKISLQDNIDGQDNVYAYDEQTICHNWCLSSAYSNESWAIECTWKNCSGCSSCNNIKKPQTQQSNMNFFTDITP